MIIINIFLYKSPHQSKDIMSIYHAKNGLNVSVTLMDHKLKINKQSVLFD